MLKHKVEEVKQAKILLVCQCPNKNSGLGSNTNKTQHCFSLCWTHSSTYSSKIVFLPILSNATSSPSGSQSQGRQQLPSLSCFRAGHCCLRWLIFTLPSLVGKWVGGERDPLWQRGQGHWQASRIFPSPLSPQYTTSSTLGLIHC